TPAGPLLARARAWATGSPLRSAAVAGGLVALMAGTIAAWLVLADLAAPAAQPTLEDALASLDGGDYELAGSIVTRLQQQRTILTADYGGPLFVLGAIRAQQAQTQWAPERRRRDYLVASKYLTEAIALGVPEDRRYQALYLLGKALIGSDQLQQGVDVLLEALQSEPTHRTEIHRLLARAYYFAKKPDYAAAVRQLDSVLADTELPTPVRDQVTLRKVRALSRLGRHAEAEALLQANPAAAEAAAGRLVTGQVLLRTAGAIGDKGRRASVIDAAEQALVDAERRDKLATNISAESQYLRGQIDQLRGGREEAMRRYLAIRKRFGMASAGIAASTAEGELLREAGNTGPAIDAYRRALDAVEEVSYYQSELLSLAELQSILLGAHGGFVADGQFEAALKLLEQMDVLIGHTRRLELRADTQQRWGERLLDQPTSKSVLKPERLRLGRRRLREAGSTFEELAEARYATPRYPDELWRAAGAYYRGQSYTSASRLLREYLKNEPERRNAQALLLLGKSLLALGQSGEAIEVFGECIEFHTTDAATYGARLAAAQAHRNLGQPDRAEALLRENLLGGDISPRSPEWRDSKFELGSVLHSVGSYIDAINHLEEAILRYPDSPKTRLARYLVAESYRHAAEAPMQRFREAKAVNERENNERLFRRLLESARDQYELVQREISRSSEPDDVDKAMLRNCYMLKGSVLFDLGRYKEAVDEYSNVSALYQNEPFVLETLVQISNCWRRLGEREKARGNIEQALVTLSQMPGDADFANATTRSRVEWEEMLNEIKTW
ncbi:MAG: tetratricopeptide repeat protein, partial [Planctomycetota bacterium]